MDNFFQNDETEKSIFEGAPSFWEMRHGITELAKSMMPEARDITVKGIPQASAQALCRNDDLTDRAYA